MTNTIQLNRKDLIAKLSSIKDDNISIADIVIERRKLLEALKLQTQEDILNINYGMVSWHYDYKMEHIRAKYQDSDGMSKFHDDCEWEYEPYTLEPQPCIQFSCNHTVMRFMNHPKTTHRGGSFSNPAIPLNFVDGNTEFVKPELTGIPLDTQELIRALTFVYPCVATEQTRPVLNCVLLESGDDVIKLVTADGFRLGIATIHAKGIPQDKVIIHPIELYTFLKSIKPTGKGKSKAYPGVYLNWDTDEVTFQTSNNSFETTNLPKMVFPDYTQLIPKDGTHVQFIACDMLTATKALSYIAKDGSGIIRLQFQASENKVVLSTRSEDLGDTTAECDAKVDADCKIAVNTKYLIDLLSQCRDNIVDMRLTDPSSPMVFNIGEDRQQVLMPMFVQWEENKSTIKEPANLDNDESAEPKPEEITETITEPA